MKLFKTLGSEFTYFWKSFLENLPEWFATICLGLVSVVIALMIEPKERIAFFENFNERYPYSGETLGIPIVALLIIILPCAVLGILTLAYPRRMELNLAGMSLAQSLCLTLLITEALKVTVARPRPNFFSYCQYDQNAKKCTGPSSHKRDARLSFPSGHASNAFATGTWMCLFLGEFFHNSEEIWWIILRFIPIMIATFIAATRITDYMHHVSDVISGVVIGIGCSTIIFRAQSNRIFMTNHRREEPVSLL
ncbi:PAP2 superfamily protein [Trichomonas vaginalis G3]|uniref:PAP2 superfamily protein n=1 Tax=Trichomonas vaginalis (strain ATCC PRA-98 / G3) TaxID=412133 RepID=A2DTD8_TRIV3|nr:phosphatidate phosphatase protein [Trichomonas vaginalis G3]EAY16247.1 PAP2 superfamily protein [Trichomonas vaginalis G3]KAI5523386.1 phosphatidate phosphatase protein [Trichomonas vaginalis G3]|eukprot:XP_001328470.1 PAP2 superfamily protein [Trichomonas vaginalis G3]